MSAAQDTPLRTKVLLIGLDGVRVDILAAAQTPVIDSLASAGFFSDEAKTRVRTVSGPGWSSMVIGARTDRHLVDSNDFSGNDYATYPDFLTRIERERPELNTLAVVDWPPLGTTDSGGPLFSDEIDVRIDFDGELDGYRLADSLSVEAAAKQLRETDVDAAFVYLGEIDVVGHETNSRSPQYRAAIEWADTRVGLLLQALRDRPTYADEDWLILMSTDHGRNDAGGHGGTSPSEKTIFFLASGPSVEPGRTDCPPEIVDVAVTALAHLGLGPDPAWGLQGEVRGLKQ
ncbi:MAG: alkaline phosphatase family protein [Candidatus Palauibacterales bacterium]|jgi:predicted AlkP superfamily pyrophosphatase or phosphodiesterase|nr:alkaline phosphatase family protein [Candidatus Palauibacterales bacterium]MDP2483330.1 alkaline phosphatase family protein [Candidatus Palauibacterales bacterium]